MAAVGEQSMELKENNVGVAQNESNKPNTNSVDHKPGTSYCNLMVAPKLKNEGRIPRLFERSSKKWWNPQMDSEILEEQCLDFMLEQSIWYFRLALLFISVACVSWIIYFGAKQQPDGWIAGIIWAVALLVICALTFFVTCTDIYKKFSSFIAVGIAGVLIATVIVAAYKSTVVMTSVGLFFLAAEVILLLYTLMPLPLYINFALGIFFSVVYEVLFRLGLWEASATDIIAHVLLHICLHIIGVQICLNLQVRRRSTFWKVGQIINSNQSVQVERKFKKVMIDSIMPKSVLENLMAGGINIFKTPAKGPFRPLYVDGMENVSILYADIVGFTKMSTNKTAAELVNLLNDLFGRFDELCNKTGCEKISTLGDCYYCVAGCPDPKPDHAKCCVEMGLGMISAIRDFCADNNVNVDMRIGIHTGSVICGIVGVKRFKFDVWSNDVSFANQMEQWGVPGRIHVSASTKNCLGDEYEFEDGRIEERVPADIIKEKNIKTYLIVKRANEDSETYSLSEESGISSSQEGLEGSQNTPDKVDVENECAKTHSNGVAVETNNDAKPLQDGEAQHDVEAAGPRVGATNENQNPEKNPQNGMFDHDSAQQTDPLLNVKQRTASHRHHHSSRKSKKKPESGDGEHKKQDNIFDLMMPFLDSTVRQKQDKEFVKTIKDNPRMKNINNNKTLKPISMRFKEETIEKAYRNKYKTEVHNHEPITSFVSARFSFFLDLFISFIVFLLVFFAALASFGPQTKNVAWIVFFVVFFCLMIFVISVSGAYVFNIENSPAWIKTLIKDFSGWLARHFIGAVLLLCPAGIVFSQMWCRWADSVTCAKYLIIMGVVFVHFLNFNQLSSWIRSITASLVALAIMLVAYLNPCGPSLIYRRSNDTVSPLSIVSTICIPGEYKFEFVLDVLLLMLFIFIVNREYEVGHRLTYYSAHEAEENKNKMEKERNQIDQLLYHIIPPRVTDVIRDKKVYSQNHENVAVIFASITNFTEFYEEQFKGGRECIRILNELIGDVDDLLDKEKYADVEKIKTIGSTFMIASGLNPHIERDLDSHSHLCTLMDFSMEMQDVIYDFNENMVCFTFTLRIGFNHGAVTAGVIGSTKLLYDIWGDTVNIASRMDSTGVPGKIQVSEESMRCLAGQFDFQYRGSTYVKGKGEMQTYLLHREGDEERCKVEKNVPYNEY